MEVILKFIVRITATILVFAAIATAQDQNLRKQYGDSVGEVYQAADDVIVTTSRAANKRICKLRIEHRTQGKMLTDAEVDSVLDRIVPPADRGKFLEGGFLNLRCPPDDCSGTLQDYKRLSIAKIGGKDSIEGPNSYGHVTVLYHRPECEEPIGGAFKR